MAYGLINADVIGTSVAGSNLGAGNASTLKNRLINGAMVIQQRGNSPYTVPSGGGSSGYCIDRFTSQSSQASKISVTQSSTAPTGFSNSALITSLAATTVGSTDYFTFEQRVEGFNTYDLGWGTASAKTVTLSFWVQSSLTGTFGGAIINGANNYSYPFTYSIPVANTWTQISVTIAGPTSGTWIAATNATSMTVGFGLGVGSTYSGAAGSWAATYYASATGATSVVGTNGATFYITGVQLEVGSSATGFEYRQYGQELALCQRYFYLISQPPFRGVVTAATGAGRCGYNHPVTMRAAPTLVASAALPIYDGAATSTATISNNYSTISICEVDLTGATGLTAYRPAIVYQTGSSNLQVSAEL